jgi:hypothetical protein
MNGLRKYDIYIQWKLCSAIKKSEILLFAGKWMELENIISSEVSQVQKAKGHMFYFYYIQYSPNTNPSNIVKNRSH